MEVQLDCRKIAAGTKTFCWGKKKKTTNQETSHCLNNLFNISQRKNIFWGFKGFFPSVMLKCSNSVVIGFYFPSSLKGSHNFPPLPREKITRFNFFPMTILQICKTNLSYPLFTLVSQPLPSKFHVSFDVCE